MVPTLSIVFMAIALLISVMVPVLLLIYFVTKKGASVFAFFVGATVMMLFAFVLESAAHRAVLGSELGAKIQASTWLYALYGGLMAGLFEETGRFLAFSTLLKKHHDNDANALMYGAGHGGFEAFVLVGLTMISNIAMAVGINNGNLDTLTGSLSPEQLAQLDTAVQTLIQTPSWHFLAGGLERVFAIAMQIALSVLVWFAVKALSDESGIPRSKLILFPVAILIHFVVDAVTVIMTRTGASVFVLELVIALMAVVVALYARRVWQQLAEE